MLSLSLSVFTGPLDVLLGMVARAELDPTTVPIADVVRQYLLYRASQDHAPEEAADFVAMASRLMVLKSEALLPRPAPPPAVEDEPVDLEDVLAEYRRFKTAAGALREREESGLRSFPRLAPPPELPPGTGLDHVTLTKLATIVQDVLTRRPEPAVGVVAREPVTIRDMVERLLALLTQDRRVSFTAFISAGRSRIEVVVAFLAVLEVVRRGRARAEQPAPFGDIYISSVNAAISV
jgi:segregation and condensation protein A